MNDTGSNSRSAHGTHDRLRRVVPVADEWTSRRQLPLAVAILVLGTLPFISVINEPPHADVNLYRAAATEIAAGKMPYRDFVFEYPPYAIPLFLLPSAFGDENYVACFYLLAIAADVTIKCLLLLLGQREAKGIRSLLPIASYCLVLPFIRYFYLQRYDVFLALVSLMAVWLFSSRSYALSGLLIAVGAGLKLYPALFAPPLFVLAWRESKGKQFLTGLAGGALPILLLSFWLPWWRFLDFHNERGLQAESVYASVLWLGSLLSLIEAQWIFAQGSRCFEVHGALADVVLPWSRFWFLFSVGISTVLACWAAARSQKLSEYLLPIGVNAGGKSSGIDQMSKIAELLLLPVLAFVIFNQVFSPQFMIWLLPLVAIVSVAGKPTMTVAVSLSAMLTPLFYPTFEYTATGLNVFQTLVLVTRNFILIGAWICAIREGLLEIRKYVGARCGIIA